MAATRSQFKMLRKRPSNVFRNESAQSQTYPQPQWRTLILESPIANSSSAVNEFNDFDFQFEKPHTRQQDAEPLFDETYYLSSADEDSPPLSPPLHARPARYALSSFEHKSSFSKSRPTPQNEQPDETAPDLEYDSSSEDSSVEIATAVSITSHTGPRVIDIMFQRPRGGSWTSTSSVDDSNRSSYDTRVSGYSTPASSISDYHNLVPASPFQSPSRSQQQTDDVDYRPFRKALKGRSTGNSLDRIDERPKSPVRVHAPSIRPADGSMPSRMPPLGSTKKSISSVWRLQKAGFVRQTSS